MQVEVGAEAGAGAEAGFGRRGVALSTLEVCAKVREKDLQPRKNMKSRRLPSRFPSAF